MTTDATNRSKLTCSDVEALISGIIDGELDQGTRHAAEVHLQHCPSCRAKVNEAEALDELVVSAGERMGPDVLPERIRLNVMGAIDRERNRSLRLPMATWSGWAMAAVLALLITVGSLTGWVGGGGGATPPGTRLQLASHEREALTFVRLLARAMSGELSDGEYQATLDYLRDAEDRLGESLVDRLLGSTGRTALSDLSERADLTDAQRQVLELAEQLVTDLETGEPVDRRDWQRLDETLQLFSLS